MTERHFKREELEALVSSVEKSKDVLFGKFTTRLNCSVAHLTLESSSLWSMDHVSTDERFVIKPRHVGGIGDSALGEYVRLVDVS